MKYRIKFIDHTTQSKGARSLIQAAGVNVIIDPLVPDYTVREFVNALKEELKHVSYTDMSHVDLSVSERVTLYSFTAPENPTIVNTEVENTIKAEPPDTVVDIIGYYKEWKPRGDQKELYKVLEKIIKKNLTEYLV